LATPVTIPEAEPTVATPELLLLQMPPVVTVLNDVVDPAHTIAVPVIDNGKGWMVIVIVRKQPVGKVYVIVAVPANTPVTIPVPEPTDAVLVLPLDHVPPGLLFDNTIPAPTHTADAPLILAGNGCTVTDFVT
jgi:hypothetical protein